MSPPDTDSVPPPSPRLPRALPGAFWPGALKDSVPEPGNSPRTNTVLKFMDSLRKGKYWKGLVVAPKLGSMMWELSLCPGNNLAQVPAQVPCALVKPGLCVVSVLGRNPSLCISYDSQLGSNCSSPLTFCTPVY